MPPQEEAKEDKVSTTSTSLSSSTPDEPLRVCCYGSSSKSTPQAYLTEAYSLGHTLAKRGHTCVNGAGNHGCMGSMNRGVIDGDGYAVGVIHELFIVDGGDWKDDDWAGCYEEENNSSIKGKNKRQLLIAKGKDLQQRKKMLMDGADAIVVLPGGPGTFDELWEMACARGLGLIDMPIVCVNVNGYYDNFAAMLQRASNDKLLYKDPQDIMHFEGTSVDAMDWIETHIQKKRMANNEKNENTTRVSNQPKLRRKKSILSRASSMLSSDILRRMSSFLSSESSGEDDIDCSTTTSNQKRNAIPILLAFGAGIVIGTTGMRMQGKIIRSS